MATEDASAPEMFKRTEGGVVFGKLRRSLPPGPVDYPELKPTWQDLRPYLKPLDVAQTLFWLLLDAVVLIALLVFVPISRISLVSIWAGCIHVVLSTASLGLEPGLSNPIEFDVEWFYPTNEFIVGLSGSSSAASAFLNALTTVLGLLMAWLILKKLVRAFPRLAMKEEQGYRQCSEQWNVRQRLTASAVFGAIHFNNLVYPIAGVPMAALYGWIMQVRYRRTYRETGSTESALLQTAALHALHNSVAAVFGAVLVLAVILLGLVSGLSGLIT